MVLVKIEGKDHERFLGRVYLGSRDINAEMVKGGHAWAFLKYFKDLAFVGYEAEAREGKKWF